MASAGGQHASHRRKSGGLEEGGGRNAKNRDPQKTAARREMGENCFLVLQPGIGPCERSFVTAEAEEFDLLLFDLKTSFGGFRRSRDPAKRFTRHLFKHRGGQVLTGS